MTKHTLSVEPRSVVGRKVKKLRSQGLIPGVIFGKSVATQHIQFSSSDFLKLLSQMGESGLVYLRVISGQPELPALIRECARHPLTQQIIHVSFHQVSLQEKVTATVPIKTTGESPAERDQLGILVHHLDKVEIEALPTDIPEAFVVDITELTAVNQSLTVADLKFAADKITLLTDPSSIIIQIEPLAAEETIESPPLETGTAATTTAQPVSESTTLQ